MVSAEGIVHWISGLPSLQSHFTSPTAIPTANATAKRKRPGPDRQQQQQQPISPPQSPSNMSNHDGSPSPKKRRMVHSAAAAEADDFEYDGDTLGLDIDATPRAPARHRPIVPRSDTSSSTRSCGRSRTTNSASQRSGASSPRKVMAAMELTEEPVRQCTLSKGDPNLPRPVREMLLAIEKGCKYGTGIISQEMQVSISFIPWELGPDPKINFLSSCRFRSILRVRVRVRVRKQAAAGRRRTGSGSH